MKADEKNYNDENGSFTQNRKQNRIIMSSKEEEKEIRKRIRKRIKKRKAKMRRKETDLVEEKDDDKRGCAES